MRNTVYIKNSSSLSHPNRVKIMHAVVVVMHQELLKVLLTPFECCCVAYIAGV